MPCCDPEMSPIRSRSVAAKISSVSNWKQNLNEIHKISEAFHKSLTLLNTADSGIEGGMNDDNVKGKSDEALTTQFVDWSLCEERVEYERSEIVERISSHQCDVSDSTLTSVSTAIVLKDFRNNEGTAKSGSGESYNSWDDEYQECAFTDALRIELKRMERVLQCKQAIPVHYDKDEYKLWIKSFPCLRSTNRHPSMLNPLTSPLRRSRKLAKYPKRNKDLNNTTNPGTVDIKVEQSFVQLAPVNAQHSAKGSDLDWLSIIARSARANNAHEHYNAFRSRKKATIKASTVIVLPPINATVRSVSAATMADSTLAVKQQFPMPHLHHESGSALGCARFQEGGVFNNTRRKRTYK